MEPTLMSGIWGGPEQVCFLTPVLYQLSTAAYEELLTHVVNSTHHACMLVLCVLLTKVSLCVSLPVYSGSQVSRTSTAETSFLVSHPQLITCVLLDITCLPSDVYFVAALNITALCSPSQPLHVPLPPVSCSLSLVFIFYMHH
ncbi:hypothetical protein ILYODFUR_033272 [Ilyodon furcidens]|uniref:Uncharacterized protein n=1 Tax=Ilyodon furcidens TaxID=33524 RepID=A0ABV0T297_9TELE